MPGLPSSGAYSISTNNTNVNLKITSLTGGVDGLPPLNGRDVTSINKLDVYGYEGSGNNPLGDLTANFYKLNNLLDKDGSIDWARYAGDITIAIGASSETINVESFLAKAPSSYEVRVSPQSDISSAGVSNYWYEISGYDLIIYTNAITTASISFDVVIELD